MAELAARRLITSIGSKYSKSDSVKRTISRIFLKFSGICAVEIAEEVAVELDSVGASEIGWPEKAVVLVAAANQFSVAASLVAPLRDFMEELFLIRSNPVKDGESDSADIDMVYSNWERDANVNGTQKRSPMAYWSLSLDN